MKTMNGESGPADRTPPVRLDANGGAFYDPWWAEHADVTLDGQPVVDCVYADTELGLVVICDPYSRAPIGGKLAMEERRGVVVIAER